MLRSEPLGRVANAAVDTDGIAIDLRPSTYGDVPPRQIEVTSDVLAFVGTGDASTPPAPTTTNSAYHEAGAAIPSELIEKLSLIGPKEKLREDIEAWRESIVTTLLVAGDVNTIRTAAEVVLG